MAIKLSQLPGPKYLKEGTKDEGYFGSLPASEFITGDELNKIIVKGNDYNEIKENSNTVWHKFAWKGKVLYISQKHIANGVSYHEISRAGAHDGSKRMTIQGVSCRLFLPEGAIPGNYVESNGDFAEDRGAKGSQWNRLMLPLSASIRDNSWKHPELVENDLQDWGTYLSNTELDSYNPRLPEKGNSSLCKDIGLVTDIILRGGGTTGCLSKSNADNIEGSSFFWRPVVQVSDSIIWDRPPFLELAKFKELTDKEGFDDIVIEGRSYGYHNTKVTVDCTINESESKYYGVIVDNDFRIKIPVSSLKDGENEIKIRSASSIGEETFRLLKLNRSSKTVTSNSGYIEYKLKPFSYSTTTEKIFILITREIGDLETELLISEKMDQNYVKIRPKKTIEVSKDIAQDLYEYTYESRVTIPYLLLRLSRESDSSQKGVLSVKGLYN